MLFLSLLLTGCMAEEPGDIPDAGWDEYQQQIELPDEEKKNSYPEVFTLAYPICGGLRASRPTVNILC